MSGSPAGWVECTFEEVADVQLGKMLDKMKNRGEPTPYLRNINVRWGAFDIADLAEMKMSAEDRRAFGIRDGDLMVCEGGEPGRAAVWRGGETALTFQKALMRVRPRPGVEPDFLQALLRQAAHDGSLEGQFTGTTIKHLPQNVLRRLSIALAPSAEQRRIVAKLDALSARTARARADLDRLPALAARYRQAVLAKAFSGELSASWREGAPPPSSSEALRASILDQRQRRRSAEGVRGSGANRSVPMDERSLPDLPQGWAWMNFDQCSWDLTVGHVGPMRHRYVTTGIPFLRSLNIKANAISPDNLVFIAPEFHAQLAKSQLRAGTIVVIRTGEPGVAAVIPDELDGANCSDLVICRPVDGLSADYGARYINSDFAKSFIRDTQVGVAQQHFNVGAMSKLPVPIAPADEQAEIVRRIDHAFAEIDRLAAAAAAARRLLDRLDQAILAKAFRGELVPQDPADEPASVLLDRIRAERAATPKLIRPRAARSTKVARTPKEAGMAKSRLDSDVKASAYLAGVLRRATTEMTTEALYKASELPVADFYKQLDWEIEQGLVVEAGEVLRAA